MTEQRDPHKLVLINPDCNCVYAIYLNFNNAKGSFCHLTVCLLW